MTATDPKPGERMPDGAIYAGVSPDTGTPMYAMQADAPLTYTFNEAVRYARDANARKVCGHDDWHLPTAVELEVLFNNRAAITGFDETDSGWYLSAPSAPDEIAYILRFADGEWQDNGMDDPASVRLVRCSSPKAT
jgi:hypothetical protein